MSNLSAHNLAPDAWTKLLQRFFVEMFGMEDDISRELWRARLVLNGAEHFDSGLIGRLHELTRRLRAPVNQALKAALGVTPDAPLHVAAGQAAILPHMGLLGRRNVCVDDLVGLAG